MEVIAYDESLHPAVTAFYNRAIEPVPHCYPASEDALGASLGPHLRDEKGDSNLYPENVFVAREGTDVLGFVHVANGKPHKDDTELFGMIRFLGYEPGHRTAGQALLEAAEAWARGLGRTAFIAFEQHHTYAFYCYESSYLSDRLGHVAALLGRNGYRRYAGEVFLEWPDYAARAPEPLQVDVAIRVEWKDGAGVLPNCSVQALQGDEVVGTCRICSGGEYAQAEEAQAWAFVEWLGVDEPLRGKRLGAHLLQRALNEMHAKGYRHASISTACRNTRAALFYSNFGYQVFDWTYGWRRDMADSP